MFQIGLAMFIKDIFSTEMIRKTVTTRQLCIVIFSVSAFFSRDTVIQD